MGEIPHDKLKVLYKGVCEANTNLHNQVLALQRKMQVTEAEKEQWIQEKARMQEIVQRSLNDANAKTNAVLEENAQLKQKLRKLADDN